MYRPTITLLLALAGSLCYGAGTATLTLELIDSNSGSAIADVIVIPANGPASDPVRAEITQKNRQFHPQTLIIPKNSRVDFPNRDNTQHHVYSFSPAKVFNIELYAGRPEAPVVFDKTGVVEIGCNIHDHMQAFILVTDSTPAGRTDEQGRLTLDLPTTDNGSPGDSELQLQLWHPRLTDNTRMVRLTIEPPYADPIRVPVELSPQPASNDQFDGLQERFREL